MNTKPLKWANEIILLTQQEGKEWLVLDNNKICFLLLWQWTIFHLSEERSVYPNSQTQITWGFKLQFNIYWVMFPTPT